MSSPGSHKTPDDTTGTFSCFLCEADGFTARQMEQHIRVNHSSRPHPAQASDEAGLQSHINKVHPQEHTSQTPKPQDGADGKPSFSSTPTVGNSCGLDGADVPEFLETSLRLNDRPSDDDSTEHYNPLNDIDDEVNNENDDADTDGRNSDDKDTLSNDAFPEESNLSVILGSLQREPYGWLANSQSRDAAINPTSSGASSNPERNTGTTASPEQSYGGARPKQKLSTPSAPVVDLTLLDSEASGGHTSKHEVEKALTCPFCSFQTCRPDKIQQHVSQEHMGDEGLSTDASTRLQFFYSCPFCADCFDCPRDLSDHIDHHHQEGEVGVGSSSWSSVDEGGGGREVEGLRCPVCGLELKEGNEQTLAVHVNQHFASFAALHANPDRDLHMAMELQREEEKRFQHNTHTLKTVQAEFGMDSSMTAKEQFDKDLTQAAMRGKITTTQLYQHKRSQDHTARTGVDDGSSQVPGIIEQLQQFYKGRGCPRTVTQAFLSDSTHHYSGSYGDKGWGCGYRNLQMMLSCLMNDPQYLQVLFNGKAKMPSISKLQGLIEQAWGKGFDPQGRQQLGGALVNTRKWIGATEIVALLSSFRIKCELIDFTRPSGPDNTHPALFDWVQRYYTSPSPRFKPPLYLQHQGHSRSIIGMEELKNGNTNLLIFDPGVPKQRMEQFHGNINYNLLQTIRKTFNAFRAKQYQIVAVVGVLNDAEYERSKFIHSKKGS